MESATLFSQKWENQTERNRRRNGNVVPRSSDACASVRPRRRVEDPELGQIVQLQGDQRKLVAQFLIDEKIAKKDVIKVHGS